MAVREVWKLAIFAAALFQRAFAQCCPDGATPTCAAGSFSSGPPPSCSGGGNPTCTSGSVGPNQPCSSSGGGSSNTNVKAAGQLSEATGCGTATGTSCANDGSTTWSDTSGLTYSSTSGKFTGTLKANQCPPTTAIAAGQALTSTCKSFTFPDGGASAWDNPPYGANLRGTLAYTFSLNYIYGPMDAGFGSASTSAPYCDRLTRDAPEVCSKTGVSCCPPGTTVAHCEDKIRYECETNGGSALERMFLDDCGFHTPDNYHAHIAPRCDYNQANPVGHSPIVGIAQDGYAMYGVYETNTTMPDLDACNGHTGPVPANTKLGLAASTVYHYHFTPYAPFTIGCFGPIASLNDCKALYSECSSGTEATFTGRKKGGGDYTWTGRLDCPCFTHGGVSDADKADQMTELKTRYGDIMATIDEDGYNTVGSTESATGYVTSGTGSGSTNPVVGSTPSPNAAPTPPPTQPSPTANPSSGPAPTQQPTPPSPTANPSNGTGPGNSTGGSNPSPTPPGLTTSTVSGGKASVTVGVLQHRCGIAALVALSIWRLIAPFV